MPAVADDPRRGLVVEMARWDDVGKVVIVPIVLEDRTYGCAVTRAAIHAILEHVMAPADYVAALRQHSAAVLALAQAKVEAGALASQDRVTIDWPDVTMARWHI
jgi:hypothetical protein